jgi:hypothetical protein
VLDFLKDDITRLESRFTGADRARLDAHLGGLQTIETQLAMTAGGCMAPTLPTRTDPEDMNSFPMMASLQINLMMLALTCGMTNVATFMFANADSWQWYPWIGVNEEHHATSHADDSDKAAQEALTQINIWTAQQIGTMLDKLAATPDSDGGTMLDNSLLLWGNELGKGNTHTYQNIPWMLAGGVGGQFRMGRFLQYQSVPHNNMLLSIQNAFGIPGTTFGDPTTCTGPLTNLM